MSETVTREELDLELRCAAMDPTAGLPSWELEAARPSYWIWDMSGLGAPWHCVTLTNDAQHWAVEWWWHRSVPEQHRVAPFDHSPSPREGMHRIAELAQDRSWLYAFRMEQRRPDIELGSGDDEDNDGACVWDVGGGFGIDFMGRVSRWNALFNQLQIPEWALQRMDWLVTFDISIDGQRAFIAVRDGDVAAPIWYIASRDGSVTAPIWYATFTPETGWSAPELAPLPAAADAVIEGARP